LHRLRRFYRGGRRWAGSVNRALFPRPEVAAWDKAKRASGDTPRFVRGRIRLLHYDLEYVDLLTLCPQWNDLFVRETFRVELATETPRILDCGANVGLASLYFKRQYPEARVTAYEADPGIAEVLRGNLSRNGSEDVEVVSAAVWIENGSIEFCCEGADSGTVGAFASGIAGKRVRVPSVRLKDILANGPVDLLKLDIEGSEETVLNDCAGELQNVRAILLDLHEFEPERRCTGRVQEILERSGFIWSLDDLSSLPWRPPTAKPDSPFPGTHLCWSVLLRAWRP
jgi:FkbM family methyltransferase